MPPETSTPWALIAEPELARAEAYRALCLEEQLEVVTVRDGQQALEALERRGRPALVVCELALPRRDGFALLGEVKRRSQAGAPVPVVVVSAFRDLRDAAVQQRDALGITALLARTSPMSAVAREVRKALNRAPPPSTQQPSAQKPAQPRAASTPRAIELPPAEPFELELDSRDTEADSEQRRLGLLAGAALMNDQPSEEELQRLVQETAAAFGVPVALVSLVLEDRQWFKAHVGLTGKLERDRGTPRDWAFCRHVVDDRKMMVVPDAVAHPYFKNNPLVLDGTVRGYAGAPLLTPNGAVLGSLCIIDRKPLEQTAEELEALQMLARRVAGAIELRQSARRSRLQLKTEKERGDALSTHLAYLEAVLDNTHEGVLLLDEQRHIVLANQALADLCGLPVEKIRGLTLSAWLSFNATLFDDPKGFHQAMRLLPKDGPFVTHEQFEIQRPRRRVLRWSVRPVRLPSGVGLLSSWVDMTAEADLLQQREKLSLTDHLTQLANRRAAEDTLEREVARSRRSNSAFSVVLLDVDHFKRVNDVHGHEAGDHVLRRVAQSLRAVARTSDLAVRWGGEEFLVLLPGESSAGARMFAERARAEVARRSGLAPPAVTVSAGVAQLAEGEGAAALLRRADAALYEAKGAGRNRVAG